MPPRTRKHEHIYTEFVSHDEETGITTARCNCGDLYSYPAFGKLSQTYEKLVGKTEPEIT